MRLIILDFSLSFLFVGRIIDCNFWTSAKVMKYQNPVSSKQQKIKTLGIISGLAINLSKSMNPPFICSIKSSPPTRSAPAFFASSTISPVENQLTTISYEIVIQVKRLWFSTYISTENNEVIHQAVLKCAEDMAGHVENIMPTLWHRRTKYKMFATQKEAQYKQKRKS